MTLSHRLTAQLLAQSKKSIRWMIQRILFLQGFSQQHQKKENKTFIDLRTVKTDKSPKNST